MSNKIDERIVEMSFDNKKFEQNIAESQKSLKEFDKALNFDGAIAGVERLSASFSKMSAVTFGIIQNLTNRVVDFGLKLAKSFTLDPLLAGMSDYETKLTTMQTITNATGKTIQEVEAYFSDLDTYADKTIYNLTDMTSSMAKFVNAGVDLGKAVPAIKGVANMTALAGQNAQAASIAMYNISQSIAGGFLTTMDYKSLNLANVATVEWKDQMINAAVAAGTLKESTNGYVTANGKAFTASQLFTEGLKNQWATTDVLLKVLGDYGDETTAIGKKAQAAAQDVKSFAMLVDTLKEAIGTGWTRSFELIIGDLEESKQLWTGISNAVGGFLEIVANGRNTMLEFWHDNGGRDAFLNGMRNAAIALVKILIAISKAMDQIFPPQTQQQFLNMFKTFEAFTEKLIIGDDAADKLQRTFAGLFAVIDIMIQVVKFFGGILGQITKHFLPGFSGGLLNITANIGDFIVRIDELIKSSGILNTSLGVIGSVIEVVAKAVNDAVGTIVNIIKSISNADTSGVESFVDKIRIRFEPLTMLATLVGSAFNGIINIIKKVAPTFYNLGLLVSNAFGSITAGIADAFKTGDFNKVIGIINGGLFATILVGIKKFISSLTDISSNAGGFLDGITGILDGVKNSIQAYQSSIKADTLLKIAGAMAILTASLVVLSMVDQNKLATSLAAMTAMFVDLFAAMAVFQKLTAGTGIKGMAQITTSMIAMSVSVLILSTAMKKLASLDYDGIAKGIIAVSALTAILVTAAKLLSSNNGAMIKGATGFVIFAASIVILSSAVEKLGSLSTSELTKGLVGVGVLVTELALFMKVADLSGMGIRTGLGIVLLSSALLILSASVKNFATLDSGSLVKGLTAVGVILAELAAFVNLTGDAKRVTSTAIGLTILGAAMLIFTSSIERLGSMSWESLGKGLLGMAGSLIIIATAMNFMPNNLILTGTGLVVIASALIILSNALSNMGGMEWSEIAKGLVTLGGALLIISGAMMLMQTALPGAAALIVVAGALAILTPVLKTLGDMSLSEIGTGLLALVGVFGVLGIAGLLLGPLTPVLLGLSGAMALLGIACLAIGGGLLAFSAGLAALAVSGTAGAAALVIILTSIIGLIPAILKTLASGIIDFIKVIGDGAADIANAVLKIILAITTTVSVAIPVVVETVFKLLTAILNTLVEYVPNIIDAGMKIIQGFLEGIGNNIKSVVEAAIMIIVNFIKGIASKLPDIIQAGIDLILSFINGISEGIRNNTDKMIDAMENLMSAVIEAGTKVLTASITGFVDVGKNIVQGLIKGLKSMISSVGDTMKDIGSSAVTSIKDLLGIHSPSTIFKGIGKNIGDGLINGLDKSTGGVSKASENMGSSVTDGFTKGSNPSAMTKGLESILASLQTDSKDSFGAAGKGSGDAFASGLLGSNFTSSLDNATKKGTGAAKKIKSEFEKFKEWLDEENFYERLSTTEEIAQWEKQQKLYKINSAERKEIDRQLYTLRKQLVDETYQNEIDKINKLNDYGKLSLTEELARYRTLQKETAKGSKEREEVNKKIFDLEKKIYETRKKWIEDVKATQAKADADRLKAQTEYDKAVKDAQNDADKSTKTAQKKHDSTVKDAEAEELKKRLAAQKKYSEEVNKAIKKEAESRIKLEKDLADDITKIQDQLLKDVAAADKKYEDSLKSRADAIYGYYGVFDSVAERDITTPEDILKNLSDQNAAIEDWRYSLQQLEGRGLSDSLIGELEQLGVSSSGQLSAMLAMTDEQLAEFVALFDRKHALANTQAASELVDYRKEVNDEITNLYTKADADIIARIGTFNGALSEANTTLQAELNEAQATLTESLTEANTTLKEKQDEAKATLTETLTEINATLQEKMTTAKDTLNKALTDINADTLAQLTTLKATYKTTMESVHDKTTAEYKAMNKDVKAELQTLNKETNAEMKTLSTNVGTKATEASSGLSTNINAGVTESKNILSGFNSSVSSLLSSFEKNLYNVGYNGAKGLADGLRSGQYLVTNAASSIGNAAINATKKAMDIHSPSRELYKVGMLGDQGLANGLLGFMHLVSDAGRAVGESSIDAIGQSLTDIAMMDVDLTPVITPVLNLDSIKKDAGILSSLMGTGQSYDLASRSLSAMTRPTEVQNGSTSEGNYTVYNTFKLEGLSVRSDADIDSIASKLYQKQETSLRGRGLRRGLA